MKTLIVHPMDRTTTFLAGIYKSLPDKTIITGGVLKSEVRKLIKSYDRIIMMGHGSPYGLFSFWNFQTPNEYIIDKTMVGVLSEKQYNIFIWCHADQFVRYHHLNGFSTGMFLSERIESIDLRLFDITADDIIESNYRFAEIMARHLDEDLDEMYQNVVNEYGLFAETNPAARYNYERLYLNGRKPVASFIERAG